ncbi:MAG: endonuclease/exonuclease/phosphatase family protein [Desulfocapsaceae bacterium]|nr:endonuclease/exonuclease/phosphatase family protein [Desulfocapsaceae bacterium]
MRFLLYNIRYATGHKGMYHLPVPYAGFFKHTRNNLDQIIDFIRATDPDIIGLVEVDAGSYRSGKCCQAEIIAEQLGYTHIVESKYANNSIASRVPVLKMQSNALLSKEKILHHCFHYFDEGIKRLVIQVELEKVVFFIVHLSLKYRHRQNQLERLHHLAMNTSKPVIIGGDFNTFWGSRELELFLAATGLHNANTANIPSHPSHSPRRQIDFILCSRNLQVQNFQIPDIRLSDHAPLICDLSLIDSAPDSP